MLTRLCARKKFKVFCDEALEFTTYYLGCTPMQYTVSLYGVSHVKETY